MRTILLPPSRSPVVSAKRSNTRRARGRGAPLNWAYRRRTWTSSIPRPCRIASPRSSARRFLDAPSPRAGRRPRAVDGDLIILGVGGKMGPTLARLAQHARAGAPRHRRRPLQRRRRCASSLDGARASRRSPATCSTARRSRRLPDAPNVVFLAGHKFGASGDAGAHLGDEHATCRRSSPSASAQSRIVAFSTGNVYRLLAVGRAGATEIDAAGAASASTRNRASAASACSSTSPQRTARRAASSASTTRSTCATACCSTSRAKVRAASRST